MLVRYQGCQGGWLWCSRYETVCRLYGHSHYYTRVYLIKIINYNYCFVYYGSDLGGWIIENTSKDPSFKAGGVSTPPTLPACFSCSNACFADAGSWLVGGAGRVACSYLPIWVGHCRGCKRTAFLGVPLSVWAYCILPSLLPLFGLLHQPTCITLHFHSSTHLTYVSSTHTPFFMLPALS